MSSAVSRFWADTDRYHDLAETYERGIEIVHPDYVTSDRLSPYTVRSEYRAASVIYYEYRP